VKKCNLINQENPALQSKILASKTTFASQIMAGNVVWSVKDMSLTKHIRQAVTTNKLADEYLIEVHDEEEYLRSVALGFGTVVIYPCGCAYWTDWSGNEHPLLECIDRDQCVLSSIAYEPKIYVPQLGDWVDFRPAPSGLSIGQRYTSHSGTCRCVLTVELVGAVTGGHEAKLAGVRRAGDTKCKNCRENG
jgi:hypothetical protein